MGAALFGSMFLGAAVGYFAERWGWTHNGYVPSILIALGGVFVVYMARVMFDLSLGSRGVDAILGAAGALFLVPAEMAYRRRRRRK